MSNIDSVIVIFTSRIQEVGTTVFGFPDENAANAWMNLQLDSPNGLRGTFKLDWVTQPFEPESKMPIVVGSPVEDVEPIRPMQVRVVGKPDAEVVIERRVNDNVMRLKSVKRITHGLTMKMEVGMLKTGVFGYTWQGMDRTTRLLLMRPFR